MKQSFNPHNQQLSTLRFDQWTSTDCEKADKDLAAENRFHSNVTFIFFFTIGLIQIIQKIPKASQKGHAIVARTHKIHKFRSIPLGISPIQKSHEIPNVLRLHECRSVEKSSQKCYGKRCWGKWNGVNVGEKCQRKFQHIFYWTTSIERCSIDHSAAASPFKNHLPYLPEQGAK